MQVEQQIENFKNYMEDKLESIEKISSENDEVLFKKIIYFSFLESLAKAAYPEDSVKQRFIKFLSEFTKWQEGNDYCPIHLIKKEKSLSTDILNTCETKRVSMIAERNSTYSTIERFAINSSEFSEDKDRHKFSYLLYNARNALVHQFQAPTEVSEFLKRRTVESPFYEVIGIGGELFSDELISYRIELIFPNSFLKKLAEDGLSTFISYCEKEEINPFHNYYSERSIL